MHVLAIMTLLSSQAYADSADGVVRIKSSYSVNTTIDRLETAIRQKGMTVFKRIDHKAGAEDAGLKLRPTELLIFGNPKVGTPLMICSQTTALDLPQKALAYEDSTGQVWFAYNDPDYLARRHGITGCDEALKKVSKALANFAKIATE